MAAPYRPTRCPFCDRKDAIACNAHAYMVYDLNPVTPGHLLVVTVRHAADFFATTPVEREAMLQLVDAAKILLDASRAPSGYTIGMNVGAVAGQTIMHMHVHVIPRYPGDTPNPRGGVRGVIPARQSY